MKQSFFLFSNWIFPPKDGLADALTSKTETEELLVEMRMQGTCTTVLTVTGIPFCSNIRFDFFEWNLQFDGKKINKVLSLNK